MSTKPKRPAPAEGGQERASPFAALAGLRDRVPEAPAAPATCAVQTPRDRTFAGKIVVARTRKGRGGKTVTTIDGIAAPAEQLELIARELRQALGVGTSVEDARIVVQGDQSARVRSLLEARGASRIVIGS